jgi:hypothetical protein
MQQNNRDYICYLSPAVTIVQDTSYYGIYNTVSTCKCTVYFMTIIEVILALSPTMWWCTVATLKDIHSQISMENKTGLCKHK